VDAVQGLEADEALLTSEAEPTGGNVLSDNSVMADTGRARTAATLITLACGLVLRASRVTAH
jgi:hypothetical protein